MGAPVAAELVTLVGLLTGAALCAMLLALVARGQAATDRSDWLPLLTALLGLVWNLGEIADYLLSRAGVHGPEPWLNVTSFAALAALAAVVVHSVARGVTARPGDHHRRVCRGRRGDCRAPARGRRRRPAAVAGGVRHADDRGRPHQRAAGRRHPDPDQRTPGAVDARAGALCGVRQSRRALPRRGGRLARRNPRPSSRAAAGVRDPLSGVPLRARRPVPQAGAGAAGGRGDRHGGLRRHHVVAARAAGSGRGHRRLGAHGDGLSVASTRGRRLRRHGAAPAGGLRAAPRRTRPGDCRRRECGRGARLHGRRRRPGPERPPGVVGSIRRTPLAPTCASPPRSRCR